MRLKRLMERLFRRGIQFEDCRSMRVVFVPHCALNQNARSAGAAEWPATIEPLVTELMKQDIGIIQMPCPEFQIFGLDRASLDLGRELRRRNNASRCRELARHVVREISDYQKCGIKVLGVIGKDGSPTCGVEFTWSDRVVPGQGVFIEELRNELRRRKITIPVIGTTDRESKGAVAMIRRWCSG